jgi:hypothetical protein
MTRNITKHGVSRRGFLGGAVAGLGLMLAAKRGLFSGDARADASGVPYAGPLLLGIHASGGWDPIFFCDPKPSAELNRVSQAVASVGPFRVSDHDVDPVAFGYDAALAEDYRAILPTNRRFFEKLGARTTVFNGVDTRTNNHETGTRYVWSGKSEVGHPALGALVGAMGQGKPPLAFLSAGGYDDVAGLVPLSRATSSSSMRKLMFPNASDPTKPTEALYHAEHAMSAIRKAQEARFASQLASATLPSEKRARAELAAARASMGELEALELPTMVDLPGNNLDDIQGVMQSIQVAMAAMKGGLSLSASLSYGSFDTHGNHDRDHVVRLAKLLAAVEFAVAEAERQGLSERLTIVVGSDFGRGPYYNGTGNGSGKDHWATTSMMVIVPPSQAAKYGNRVIGGTTDEVRPKKVEPGSFALSDAGVALTPAVIHAGLRTLLGLDASPGATRFPIAASPLAVFT